MRLSWHSVGHLLLIDQPHAQLTCDMLHAAELRFYDDESNRAAPIKTSHDNTAASNSNFVVHQMLGIFFINGFYELPSLRVEFGGMESMMMNIFIKIIDLGRFFAGDMMIMKYYRCVKTFSKHPRRWRFYRRHFQSLVSLIISWCNKFFLWFMAVWLRA